MPSQHFALGSTTCVSKKENVWNAAENPLLSKASAPLPREFGFLWASLGPLPHPLEHQHPMFAHLSPLRVGSISILLILVSTMLGRSNVPHEC